MFIISNAAASLFLIYDITPLLYKVKILKSLTNIVIIGPQTPFFITKILWLV